MQDDGQLAIVYTDGTYIHQSHSQMTSWVRADLIAEKTSMKGERLILIVLHDITK
jgi:hypothetical protein